MVSNTLRYAVVALVAGASSLAAVETVIHLAPPPLALRAAKAESPTLDAWPAAEPATGAAIARATDGHYWADGQVEGQNVRFLVDTGATAVALTPADAERLGIRRSELSYSYRVVTAGGMARAAPVRLASVTVAGARIENVEALVIEKGLDTSLLGMTYLGRLSSFQATRQGLFLQP